MYLLSYSVEQKSFMEAFYTAMIESKGYCGLPCFTRRRRSRSSCGAAPRQPRPECVVVAADRVSALAPSSILILSVDRDTRPAISSRCRPR
jgi:hypothetical protein